MIYRYRAININGKVKKGIYQANCETDLIKDLKSSGYYLLKASSNRNITNFYDISFINLKVISIVCRQIAVQMKAGTTLAESIKTCINECPSSRYRTNLNDMYHDILKGIKFSICLKANYKLYPDLMIQMVQIGEETGTLDDILIRLSTYYIRESKIKNQIRTSLTYPAFLIVCTLAISIILMINVLPQFSSILAQVGAQVPAPTLFLEASLNSFKENALFYMLSFLTVLFICRYYLLTQKGQKILSYLKLKIPVIKKIYIDFYQLRFISSMHVLISAGFNPLKSIEISCSVSEEGLLKDRMKVCISEVKKGKSLYEAMSKADIFKIDFLSAIKVGEESGNLKDTIKEVLDIMESDVVENYKKAVQCIEPLLIIIIGLFITQIVFAFLLPAISIMDSLGNQI